MDSSKILVFEVRNCKYFFILGGVSVYKMKEESIFVEYFGDTPLVRILNFLILGKDFDYSMTDIAEGSHI